MQLSSKTDEIITHLRALGFAARIKEQVIRLHVENGITYDDVLVGLETEQATGMASLTQTETSVSFQFFWNRETEKIEGSVGIDCYYLHPGGGGNGVSVRLRF